MKIIIIYDESVKKFQEIFTFPGLRIGVDCPCVVYSERRNTVYVLGGYDWGKSGDQFIDRIWKCKIDDKNDKKCEWIEWETKCILTPDENFIVVFSKRRVIILDIEKEECVELEHKFPEKFNPQHAVLANSKPDDVLVIGYIREISNEIGIIVPNELIGLMIEYCASMNIHLICKGSNEHYMIPLEDILNH